MKKILLGLLTTTLIISVAKAGVVLSDSFDYAEGNLTTVSSGIWTAHSGTGSNPIQVFTNTPTSGLIRVRELGGSAEDVNAALFGAPYLASAPAAKLYSSYTLILSNTLPSDMGTYVSHFRGTNTGSATDYGARVFVLRTNIVSGGIVPDGKFRLAIANGSAGTNRNALGQIDQDLDTNVVYTIVTRFVPSTGVATIWLNPTAEGNPSATATDVGTVDAPNPFNVFTYAFRQGNDGGTFTCSIDDLKIGTQFNDVAGANTAPLISSIPDQSVPRNIGVTNLDFTVQDGQTTAASLIVSNSTSNPTLVPAANISLGGAATNRTITVTPAPGQQGSADITVYVSDGPNVSATTFSITVGAPSMSAIPSQISITNVPTAAIPFTITDAESDSLIITSNYTNPTLVSSVAIVAGTPPNYTVQVTPVAGQQGVSFITINATDGFNTTTRTFSATFTPLLGLIYSDNFDLYADGPLVGAGGPWSTTSGLSVDNEMLVTNGTVQIDRNRAEDVNTDTGFSIQPFPPASGVVLYSGFTINAAELPTTGGNYFAHFKDASSTGFDGKIFTSRANAAAGHYRIGIANFAGSQSVQVANDLALNTTYLIVSRYNVGTGESVVWVNPTASLSGGAAATDNPSPLTITSYGLRQDAFMGVLYLDNLKIGTSLANVATIPSLTQTLTIQLLNGEAVLSWGAPLFALQSAPAAAGPYTTIPGATSPYTNAPAASEQFFRLKY